jgi:hypothetical protein
MLEGRHFQVAYVCDDIEEAAAAFVQRGYPKAPRIFEVTRPAETPGGEVTISNRLCFFWYGDFMYELIQPLIDPIGMYSLAPASAGPMRFHHTANRIDDWDAFRARAAAQDLPEVMWGGKQGDDLKFSYIDARTRCGHFLEFAWATDERWKMLKRA